MNVPLSKAVARPAPRPLTRVIAKPTAAATARGPLKMAVQRPAVKKAAPAASSRPRSVVLEAGLLDTMASQDRFLKEFPALRHYAAAAAKCRSCTGRRKFIAVLQATKAAFASLGDPQRQTLKTLLGVEQITVHVGEGPSRRLVSF